MLPIRPLKIQGVVQHFMGMVRLRGQRRRDKIILLATIIIQILILPLRFCLLISQRFFVPDPASRLAGWSRWLDSLGYSVPFDCIVVNPDGCLFKLRHRIDDAAQVHGNHEQSVMRIFCPEEGETVIDVGANIGLYTIKASRLVGSKGKVISIEAEPSNLDALRLNLELNRVNNVIPINLAAWDQEALLDLYTYDEAILHSLFCPQGAKLEAIKVEARPVDRMLEEAGIVETDWIKIDVEGAEVEVLRGLKETMAKNANLKILVEVHSNELKQSCLSILKESGHEVRQINSNHLFASPISR